MAIYFLELAFINSSGFDNSSSFFRFTLGTVQHYNYAECVRCVSFYCMAFNGTLPIILY